MSVTDNERQKISAVFSKACSAKNLCPIKDIMARYGDKWSLYTLLLLGQHPVLRFNELRTGIKGISQRMLTVTLRSLEEDGMISRTIYPEVPPRVEYQLTTLGESLVQHLLQLATWAADHMAEITKARRKHEKKLETKRHFNKL